MPCFRLIHFFYVLEIFSRDWIFWGHFLFFGGHFSRVRERISWCPGEFWSGWGEFSGKLEHVFHDRDWMIKNVRDFEKW